MNNATICIIIYCPSGNESKRRTSLFVQQLLLWFSSTLCHTIYHFILCDIFFLFHILFVLSCMCICVRACARVCVCQFFSRSNIARFICAHLFHLIIYYYYYYYPMFGILLSRKSGDKMTTNKNNNSNNDSSSSSNHNNTFYCATFQLKISS